MELVRGKCSYSLYLLHGKLDQLPAMAVRQFLGATHPLQLPLVVCGTSALCYAFYRVIERRCQGGAAPP